MTKPNKKKTSPYTVQTICVSMQAAANAVSGYCKKTEPHQEDILQEDILQEDILRRFTIPFVPTL